LIISSSAAGVGRDASTSPYEPWFGRPSRHSAAQTMAPPFLTTLAAGRHAFDRLIQILIERISRVRREDDVEG